ncbi:hypothetical protein BH10CHL1_BH10CHL1_24370 [soil metagenome]
MNDNSVLTGLQTGIDRLSETAIRFEQDMSEVKRLLAQVNERYNSPITDCACAQNRFKDLLEMHRVALNAYCVIHSFNRSVHAMAEHIECNYCGLKKIYSLADVFGFTVPDKIWEEDDIPIYDSIPMEVQF